jgi:hypothetical protein
MSYQGLFSEDEPWETPRGRAAFKVHWLWAQRFRPLEHIVKRKRHAEHDRRPSAARHILLLCLGMK